jgi:hypothetical protein
MPRLLREKLREEKYAGMWVYTLWSDDLFRLGFTYRQYYVDTTIGPSLGRTWRVPI